MQYKHILEITAICAELAKTGGCPCTVSVRLGDDFLLTDLEKMPKEIREENIIKVAADKPADGLTLMHRALYAARKDINSIITYTSPYIKTAADVLTNLPAVLNDMARIIGNSAHTAQDYTPKAVVKALKHRNGCLVKEQGAVLLGGNLDEAYTAVLAIERNAKSYIDASVLGGAVKIRYSDALLMRFKYKIERSRQSRTPVAAEGRKV